MGTENAIGRPSEYDDKFCQEIIAYFSVKPYVRSRTTIYDDDGRAIEIEDSAPINPSEEMVATDFPSFAGFAAKIGVHRETLLNWTDNHPEFFDAYKRAKELQENWLLVNGMRGHVETAFAIFAAKNVLGYRDKPAGEADVNVNLYGRVPDSEIDARLLKMGIDPNTLKPLLKEPGK